MTDEKKDRPLMSEETTDTKELPYIPLEGLRGRREAPEEGESGAKTGQLEAQTQPNEGENGAEAGRLDAQIQPHKDENEAEKEPEKGEKTPEEVLTEPEIPQNAHERAKTEPKEYKMAKNGQKEYEKAEKWQNERPREERRVASRRSAPVQMARRSSGHHAWSIGYFLREGFTNIFRHGLMSFAAICTIVACLLIMGTFSLVAVDLDANRQKLEAENEFLAYVDEALTQDEAEALGQKITALDNVKDAIFVDRLQVLEEFRAEHQEDADLYALLPDDVFQHYYRVHVVEIDRLNETVGAVEKVAGIESVSAWPEVAEGMVSARNIAVGIAAVLVTMLALVSLFVIANTLRLAVFYRRDEIAIMKMCGATNGFVRWPFVTEGAILGLFSALVAFFVQWWVYDLIADAIQTGGQLSFLVILPFQDLWGIVAAGFGGAGLLIGVLGSLTAIRKFLQV